MQKFANDRKDVVNKLVKAIKSNNDTKIKEAWENVMESIADQVRADLADLQESKNAAVLEQRGYRQLTSKERNWYEKVITALKSDNPKQAFTTIIGSEDEADKMPSTIIEDVYKNLTEDHPLLQAVNIQYVGHITKWLLNDHTVKTAVWGKITAEIIEEITSSFKVVSTAQNKISAYAVIELSMLDLGAHFLDKYIREVLTDSILAGLELAIVSGNGVNQPIGLNRDIHKGVSFSSTNGYPEKTKEVVKDFTPVNYGTLLAKMAKTEKGNPRKFEDVYMVCNQMDYLTKIANASGVLTADGIYQSDVFPIPTKIILSEAVDVGSAVLFVKNEYNLLIGGKADKEIEVSDECRFLEDERAFKIKQYATGRPFDNTSSLYLDISAVEPLYLTVKKM